MPAVKINAVLWLKEAKLLAYAADIALAKIYLKFGKKCKYALLYRAGLISVSVKYLKAMAPGKLTLNNIHGVS